jgi:hypothetical protein
MSEKQVNILCPLFSAGTNKSSPNAERGALETRRRPGKERVAALMEAATAAIAERGFAAATMAEIASPARALVGSLYHFFANKDVLAGAFVGAHPGLPGQFHSGTQLVLTESRN